MARLRRAVVAGLAMEVPGGGQQLWRMGYDPERLLVYGLAIRLNRLTAPLCREAARGGRRDLASQLERAAASVALNIAEGAAETAPAEKARFYRIARRSAEEAKTALNLLEGLRLADRDRTAPARRLTTRLTILLLRLINAMNTPRRP